MQTWYSKMRPWEKNHFKCLGASLHYCKIVEGKLNGEVATVILNYKNCGAAVSTHEFLHATLYGHRHSLRKKQHPLCIKSMREEEEILHNFSYAVNQFYNWYWEKVEPKFVKYAKH